MSTQFTNRQWRLPNEENKSKQSNYSMTFDGSGQLIDLGNLDFLNTATALTVSFWFKANDALDSNWHTFLANGSLNPVSNLWCGLTRYNWSSVADGTSIQPTFSLKINGANSIVGGWGGNITTVSPNPIVNGTWYHFCGTWDGSTQKLYIDGQLKGSLSTTGSIDTTTNDTYIGASPNPTSYYFDGQMDGISIYNYALSASQVTTLYGSSSTGIGNPMSLSPKPVAYYNLGDQDAFNGSNYLVPNSSLKDYVFDFGTYTDNKYISINNTFDSIITGTNFTVSGWVKLDSVNSSEYKYIFSNETLQFAITNKLNTYIRGDNGSYFLSPFEGNTTVLANIWYHVVITKSNNTYTYYLDGVNDGSVSNSTTPQNSSQSTSRIGMYFSLNSLSMIGELSNVQIFNTALLATGSNSVETLYNNGSPLTSMSGYSSLQGWWKLDASATYDSSTTTWTIPDNSSNSNTGTSSGMTQANLVQSDLSFKTSISPFALSLDGTNDYINISGASDLSISGDLTMSIWFKADSFSDYEYILRLGSGTTANGDRMIGFKSSKISTNTYADSSGAYDVLGNTTLSTGVWYHVLVVYSSNTVIIYLNGNADSSTIPTTMGTISYVNTTIGQSYNSNYFDGSISNVSIWNTALSATQVSEIYSEGIPQNLNNHSAYSNLVSWWQLGSNSSFNTNWTVLDEKGSNNGTSVNMTEADIVDGVGSYANGTSSGMGGDEVIGDAPYSSSNSLSVNMDVLDRVTDTPS